MFSPINACHSTSQQEHSANDPVFKPSQPSSPAIAKPLRAEILKASAALALPFKKKYLSVQRAEQQTHLPRRRLCSPPPILRQLRLSANHHSSGEHSDLTAPWQQELTAMRDPPPSNQEVGSFLNHRGDTQRGGAAQTKLARSSEDDVLQEEDRGTPLGEQMLTELDCSDPMEDDENQAWDEEGYATDASLFNALTESVGSPQPSNPRQHQTPDPSQVSLQHESQKTSPHWPPLQNEENSIPEIDHIDSPARTTTQKTLQSLPFVRSGFPNPLSDSSLLPNLSPSDRILTCFRMADVLRAASLPGATLLELYATVTSSHRDQDKQYFTFSDLFFPSQALQVSGCYAGWQGIDLFEDDTQPFLKATWAKGVLCRAICMLIKRARAHQLESDTSPNANSPLNCADIKLSILNIWCASWDDIDFAKGLVL